MTKSLVPILQNPTATWVSCPWWKKQEHGYDNIISRGIEEDWRKFTPLKFDLNKKKILIFFTAFCLQVVLIPCKKT